MSSALAKLLSSVIEIEFSIEMDSFCSVRDAIQLSWSIIIVGWFGILNKTIVGVSDIMADGLILGVVTAYSLFFLFCWSKLVAANGLTEIEGIGTIGSLFNLSDSFGN